MKTPLDKIRNRKNNIVQIIVTTACNLALCSNCTQLLPFRKDRKPMTPDVFREAVRSLEGYPGVRALFGGNPCNSPYFADYCRILQEEVPDQSQRGLWTNDLINRDKANVARETFYPRGCRNLNVHTDSKAAALMREAFPGWRIWGEDRKSWHSPIMLDYRDFGISDEEWVVLRENCDINQNWSAGIAQRNFGGEMRPGVYFCEVAAAIDGVRGTNNSILAEPGWWTWPIERFQHQIKAACNSGCGVPLRRKGHLDLDFVYDYSPSWEEDALPVLNRVKKLSGVRHDELPRDGAVLATDYQRIAAK